MNDITPIGRPNMPGIERPGPAPRHDAATPASNRGRDAVELTPVAKLLSKLHDLPEVRQELIDKVQARLDEGHYDDPAVLNDALEKMLVEEGVIDG